MDMYVPSGRWARKYSVIRSGFIAVSLVLGVFVGSVFAMEPIIIQNTPEPVIKVPGTKERITEVEIAEKKPMDVESTIVYYMNQYGGDVKLALNIACAESQFNPADKNPKSTASGVYQFIKSTWRDYCAGDVFNAEDNIKCGTRLISEGAIGHWSASAKSGYGGGWLNLPYDKGLCQRSLN